MTVWGTYPWFREHGVEQIHPDSLEKALQEPPYGKVFKLLSSGDPDWIEIKGATGPLKVKPGLFRTVPPPTFDFGQVVRTLPPRTPRTGTVTGIQWHHEEKRAFYLLTVEGKQLSRRYWDDELEVGN